MTVTWHTTWWPCDCILSLWLTDVWTLVRAFWCLRTISSRREHKSCIETSVSSESHINWGATLCYYLVRDDEIQEEVDPLCKSRCLPYSLQTHTWQLVEPPQEVNLPGHGPSGRQLQCVRLKLCCLSSDRPTSHQVLMSRSWLEQSLWLVIYRGRRWEGEEGRMRGGRGVLVRMWVAVRPPTVG